MRPDKLIMQAFGSYARVEKVDFSPLNEKGIYLICGPTGGGKTTILDALCTALYGKATGTLRTRDWRGLRCRHSPRELDTIIDFSFFLGEECYRFYRRWSIKIRKNAEELDDVEDACYKLCDGEWRLLCSGSAKALEAMAEQILGLSYGQFVKVICLPQGEFRELLTTGSNERARILDRLFGTQRWKSIVDTAAAASLEAEKKLAKASSDRNALLAMREVDSREALLEEEAKCSERLAKRRELLEQSGKLLEQCERQHREALSDDEQFGRLDKLEAELNEMNAREPEITAMESKLELARQVEALIPLRDSLLDAQKRLSTAEGSESLAIKRLEKSEEELESARDEAAEAEKLNTDEEEAKEKMTRLKTAADMIERLDKAELEIKGCDSQIAALEEKRTQNNDGIKTLSQRMDKGRALLLDCESAEDKLDGESAEMNRLSEKADRLKKLDELREEEQKKRFALDLPKKLSQQLESEHDQAKTELVRLEALHGADVAYSLAAGLKEGEACPVCGSTHHIAPALPSAAAPDAKELDRAKKRVSELAERLAEARVALAKAEEAARLAAEQLSNQLATCADDAEKAQEITEGLDAARRTVADLKEKKNKKAEYKALLDKLTQQKEELEAAAKLTENELSAAQTARAGAAGSKKTIIEGLNGLSPDAVEINRLIKEETDRLEKIGQKRKHSKERLQSARDEHAEAQAEQRSAKKSVADARLREGEILADYREECGRAGMKTEYVLEAVLPEKEELEGLRKSAREFRAAYDAAKKAAGELSEQLKGRKRPDVAAVAERLERQKNAVLDVTAETGELAEKQKQLELDIKKLDEATEKLNKLDRLFSGIRNLKQLLSGQNPKKTPIDQFVLGLMLDGVIVASNGYLERLSRGRYLLCRKTETSGRDRFQGVDFEITDTEIGGQRAVSSLSGGELFLASLSLALGLSDVVQNFSGGLRLDSLFIDEGFGSLDHDTLMLAVRSISEIREGRSIGVISHIEDLRGAVEARIIVERTECGSSLHIEA